jgi:hypothetical protein
LEGAGTASRALRQGQLEPLDRLGVLVSGLARLGALVVLDLRAQLEVGHARDRLVVEVRPDGVVVFGRKARVGREQRAQLGLRRRLSDHAGPQLDARAFVRRDAREVRFERAHLIRRQGAAGLREDVSPQLGFGGLVRLVVMEVGPSGQDEQNQRERRQVH